jgi:hypothetical protein
VLEHGRGDVLEVQVTQPGGVAADQRGGVGARVERVPGVQAQIELGGVGQQPLDLVLELDVAAGGRPGRSSSWSATAAC